MQLQQLAEILCDRVVWSLPCVALLLFLGLFLCFALRFSHLTRLPELAKRETGGETTGKIPLFRVFALTTGGKVGVGNIVGVSVALRCGGPGALFWMAVFAVVGAAISYVECRLGAVYGGTAGYLRACLKHGKGSAAVFSVLLFCIEAVFMPAIQVNAAAESVAGLLGGRYTALLTAAVFAVAFLPVMLLGEGRVAALSAKLLPAAVVVYTLLAFCVIGVNIGRLPAAFGSIFHAAFGRESILSGGAAAAMAVGIKRGMFSSEAGYGIAPYACAEGGDSPHRQGLAQSLSVLTDTLFMCGLTGLMLLCAGTYDAGQAASAVFGAVGGWLVVGLIAVFAYTTVLSCGFTAAVPFRGAKRPGVFLLMTAVILASGSSAPGLVWPLCDLCGGLMALINVPAAAWIALRQRKAGLFSQARRAA